MGFFQNSIDIREYISLQLGQVGAQLDLVNLSDTKAPRLHFNG